MEAYGICEMESDKLSLIADEIKRPDEFANQAA